MSDKICIIAPHDIARERLRRELAIPGEARSHANANPHFHVIAPGDQTCGQRYTEIVITAEAASAITKCPRTQQWYDTCVRTRTTRDAEVITLK